MNAQQYDVAISRYSTALSLHPPSPRSALLKRSKAFLETNSLKEALDDATKVRYFHLTHVNLQFDS